MHPRDDDFFFSGLNGHTKHTAQHFATIHKPDHIREPTALHGRLPNDINNDIHKMRRVDAFHQLLTPEEPTRDSFEDSQPTTTKPVEPRSPPESPTYDRLLYEEDDHRGDQRARVPLFGTHTTPRATPEREPTPATTAPVLPSIVTTPPQARQQSSSSSTAHPVVTWREQFQADRVGYREKCLAEIKFLMDLKRQKKELDAAKKEALKLPSPTSPVQRDTHTKRLLESLGKDRITKVGTTAPVAIRARTEKLVATRPSRAGPVDESRKSQTPPKRASRQTSTPANVLGGLHHAAAPKPRTRQPPSKMVERKDQHWKDVPDYCPPISSLDTGIKKLTVEWTNKNHQDLSNDEDRDNLHPQELVVASTLRLKCDRYMLIKRLIFQEKVKFLKENKEFNKTSAQNCCNVDVNKISKIWQSFNDVGWFDKHWFEKFLE